MASFARGWLALVVMIAAVALCGPQIAAQTKTEPPKKDAQPKKGEPKEPSKADILRGEYSKYRANNDLLYYHLDVRVDPEKKTISGKNTIRFKMLKDDDRIQLDLHS